MGFTINGYVKRTPAEIKASMLARNQQYNPSFAEWSADIQNNLLDTAVQPVLEVENLMADTANSFAPGTSNDFMKEQLAATLGLKYKDETKAKVTLKFSGNVGVYIPKGTKVSNDFVTDAAATISSSGTAYVTASSEAGEAYAANTITEIKSVVDASLSVTNPSASFPYKAAETADELWRRAQQRLRNPNIGSTDYAQSLILACEGTSERLVNFNFIDSATKRGIEVIVGGGDTAEVANAIFQSFGALQNLTSAPSNNEADRTTTWNLSFYGSSLPIVWTSPKRLNLSVEISVTFFYVSAYEGKLAELAQTLFENQLNNQKVGMPVSKSLFDSLVMQAISAMNIDFAYVSKIDYTIKDIDSASTLKWNTNNYLNGIDKDVYTELGEFKLSVTT